MHSGGHHLLASIASLDAAHYLVEDVTGIRVAPLEGDQGLVLEFTPLAL